MPGNAFIKFKGVDKGESMAETHPGKSGWNEITDWSWDIEAETSFLKGSGAAVGKPTPGTFSITHPYDTASPAIMNRIVLGTHFAEVQVVMLKQTGAADGKGEIYFGVQMRSVFITKVSSKGGEDGSVTQDVEFVFKDIALGYRPQKQDGGLDVQMNFGWDIAKMTTDGITAPDIKNLKG